MIEPHKCWRCGQHATRWSGHDVWHEKNVGILFCCIEHDPYHKWFDYSGEPLEQDAEGRWHFKEER